MNGVTCTFWLTGEDIKAFVERNGYQHKTVRMFLYDYGIPREEVIKMKPSLLNKRFAWRDHIEYELLRYKIGTWYDEHREDRIYRTWLCGIDYDIAIKTVDRVARRLFNEMYRKLVYE